MIIIGQILGWAAALLTFLSYQCKEHKKLLIVQTSATVSMCLSYCFLGAWSGMLLNILCILRNFIIFYRERRIFSYAFWPYLLAVVMGTVGALSWQGPMSLFVIAALTANTLFLFSPNVQTLRKSVIVTSSMILIYDVYFQVWGGVANEAIAVISSIIGVYRFRASKKK